MRFEGKVAFITGGAVGFGRAFARALAAEGAAIVIADIDAPAGELLVKELESSGQRALAVRCDVADEQQVEAAVAASVARFGGIDVLINNAGKHLMKYNQPVGVLERSELRALFEVNVIGVVNCSVACRPSMAARGGGAILMIASIWGREAGGAPGYNTSKAAEISLAKAMARDLAEDGIRVNSLAPGSILFPGGGWERRQQADPDGFAAFVKRDFPFGRMGRPEEVANLALFLCSDEAAFITGVAYPLDGGAVNLR